MFSHKPQMAWNNSSDNSSKNRPVLSTGLIQKLKDSYLNDSSISYFHVSMFLAEKNLLKILEPKRF